MVCPPLRFGRVNLQRRLARPKISAHTRCETAAARAHNNAIEYTGVLLFNFGTTGALARNGVPVVIGFYQSRR